MNDERDRQQPDAEDVEREIRQDRKFTAKEALARLAGPGAMKGASPVSPVQQAETEIGCWLRDHVADTSGALHLVLNRDLEGSELLLANIDQPLVALAAHCRRILSSDERLKDIVRECDSEWGKQMDERPHFEREGAAPDPDDPYTVESVRRALGQALEKLPEEPGQPLHQ